MTSIDKQYDLSTNLYSLMFSFKLFILILFVQGVPKATSGHSNSLISYNTHKYYTNGMPIK